LYCNTHTVQDLQQFHEICQYLDEPPATISPKILCSFLGFPGDDSTPVADNNAIVPTNAPVVTAAAVSERDARPIALTTIDGTVYNPLQGPNFCGLPGMFCKESNVADATAVEARAITSLAQRAPEPAPAPLTTIDGTVYNPLRTTNFCGLPGMFCADDHVATADVPAETEAPAITWRTSEALAASLTTIDGTVYNPLHSVEFCGIPGILCDFEENDEVQKESRTQVSHFFPRLCFCRTTDAKRIQLGATPSLEGPQPNPVGAIPYIPFPSTDAEKRDQEDEAPLPLRNTKTLVQDSRAPKAGAGSTFKFGWQLILGLIIGVVGSLLLC
jgi:hypothetical protein